MRIVEVLPAPFGPRNPKASPGLDPEVDPVDRDEVVEALREPSPLDQCRIVHARRRYRHARRTPLGFVAVRFPSEPNATDGGTGGERRRAAGRA